MVETTTDVTYECSFEIDQGWFLNEYSFLTLDPQLAVIIVTLCVNMAVCSQKTKKHVTAHNL